MSNNPKKRILAAAITAALLVGMTAPASTVFAAAPPIHQADSLVHRKDPSDDVSLAKGEQKLLAAQTPTLSANPPPVLGASSYSDSWTDNGNYDDTWLGDYNGTDTWTVHDAADLAALSKAVNENHKTFEGKTITLSGDIDLSGHNWMPIGVDGFYLFEGTFDGDDHTIDSMTVDLQTGSNIFAGFFGYLQDRGTVKNVHIGKHSSVTAQTSKEASTAYAGGIAGYCSDVDSIENCTNAARIVSSAPTAYSGGLIGFSGGTDVVDCKNVGEIVSTNVAGGITGDLFSGEISDCINEGDVSVLLSPVNTNSSEVGGIAGASHGRIANSSNTGDISAENDGDYTFANAGGIAGTNYTDASLDGCNNTGAISAKGKPGKGNAGGISGFNSSLVRNSTNAGDIFSSTFAGGVTGRNDATMENCTNFAEISGFDVGGITGTNFKGNIENCTNTGILDASKYIGSIAGINEKGAIESCYWPEGDSPAVVGLNLEGTTNQCFSFVGPDGALQDDNQEKNVMDVLNAWVEKQGASYWDWSDEPQEESLTMRYPLTVVGGDGSGIYYKGEEVKITADSTPSGKRFRGWNIEPRMTLNDTSSRTLTFPMPLGRMTATANFSTIPSTHLPDKTTPETPITPTPDNRPGSPDRPGSVDTTKANVPAGGTYEALVYGVTDPSQIKVDVSDPDVAGFTISSDPRGSKIQVFGKKEGKVKIKVTANGIVTEMEVEVQPLGGSLLIDTKSVTIPTGQKYEIGLKLFDADNKPFPAETVKPQIAPVNPQDGLAATNPDTLWIWDSRTGSVVDTQILDNGHLLLTAKNPPENPVTYLQFFYQGLRYSVTITGTAANGTRAGVGNATPLYWMKKSSVN